MKKNRILVFFFSLILTGPIMADQTDSVMIRQIYHFELSEGRCYQDLEDLCLNIGQRLSGSKAADLAVEWAKEKMTSYGIDKVYLQEVWVPYWERGKEEKCRLVAPSKYKGRNLQVLALGNSVGTGEKGVQGKIIEIQDLRELESMGQALQNKILFINKKMDPTLVNTGQAYSNVDSIRYRGPAEAARYGATGVIVRSLSNGINPFPHTGSTGYVEGIPKIPAIAVSTADAEFLHDLLKEEKDVEIYFETFCQNHEDKLSYNVIGEIRGSLHPEEYIMVGGHLDSWDVGQGAHDDGTGCVQAIEALRILKSLGYQPKRTLRAVMFMNEENGLHGGKTYAEQARLKSEKHIAAIESDAGGFTPRGFGLDGTDEAFNRFSGWSTFFKPYLADRFTKGGSGADISPLRDQGVQLIGFRPDNQRYFLYHHTHEDTFDKVNQRELELGAAAMSSLIYFIDRHGW
jgi:carboxypeptidase Q